MKQNNEYYFAMFSPEGYFNEANVEVFESDEERTKAIEDYIKSNPNGDAWSITSKMARYLSTIMYETILPITWVKKEIIYKVTISNEAKEVIKQMTV